MASVMSKSKDKFNLRISLVDGAAADTNMAIAGIATDDEIIHSEHISTKADNATVVDNTATMNITSAGNVQSTADVSNDLIRVYWIDVSA